jgi:hypothetical protein
MPHRVRWLEDQQIGSHTNEDLGVDNRANVQAAKRIISGLEMTPTFDELIVEVSAPPGFQRTQSGLIVPLPRGRN